MKSNLLLCLALVLSGGLFGCCSTSRADMGVYASVEWLTAMGDDIGLYHAERIYGPHSVTNSNGGSTSGCYTADFGLKSALRGNPPPSFSRSTAWWFHAGDDYIFFFRSASHPPAGDFSADEVFTGGDYIWLDRPPGRGLAFAMDHRGCILTNRPAILKLINDSLKLPRATAGIVRTSFWFTDNSTNAPKFNFCEIGLPTPFTSWKDEPAVCRLFCSDVYELVIPQCLYEDYSSATNQLAVQRLKEKSKP
ncbi:MAG TPA: hypothetical protein VK815_09375 [Candidatus Acidoferrales bacterium]|nr:hypothetical protein [Candidatus Acidoferrales bacterium]